MLSILFFFKGWGRHGSNLPNFTWRVSNGKSQSCVFNLNVLILSTKPKWLKNYSSIASGQTSRELPSTQKKLNGTI